ncbi:hypothetical protein LXL04_023583 [Taraxacum kok-saghyz]
MQKLKKSCIYSKIKKKYRFFRKKFSANFNNYERFEGSRSRFYERNNGLGDIGNWGSSRLITTGDHVDIADLYASTSSSPLPQVQLAATTAPSMSFISPEQPAHCSKDDISATDTSTTSFRSSYKLLVKASRNHDFARSLQDLLCALWFQQEHGCGRGENTVYNYLLNPKKNFEVEDGPFGGKIKPETNIKLGGSNPKPTYLVHLYRVLKFKGQTKGLKKRFLTGDTHPQMSEKTRQHQPSNKGS